jgi:anti-sigma factor RsiW
MNTGHRTDFTDTELSAWLDGEGDASQRERVEAWLREQPEAAARVRLWAADRDVLRARFDAVRDEPVPERLLDVLRASARRGRRVQAAIAASLLLTGGLVGSMATWQWQAQRTSTLVAGAQAGTPAGWVQRAAYAHSVFTPEPRHPVEVRAQEEHLARWLTRRIDIPVKLFDLRSEGFELMGGRLLPDANGKSAQLMYENPLTKERVTVYLRKPDADAPTRGGRAAGLRVRPAAGADRPGHAGLADDRGAGRGHHRLPQPGGPALHLQVPLGAADGPLRPALAGTAPRLAGAHAAGAGRRAVALAGTVAQGRDAWPSRCWRWRWLFCRRRRTWSSTPTAPTCCAARARPGRVAGGVRLPAGDDPVRRHRLIWTDPTQGGGWTWPEVYRFMAALMVAAAVLSALLLPRLPAPPPAPPGAARPGAARHDLLGFLAVVAAVAVGVRRHRPSGGARRARGDGAAVAGQQPAACAAGPLGRPGGAAGGHRHHAAARGLGRAARALRDPAVGPVELLQPARRRRVPGASSCCTSWATPSPAR